MSGEGPEPASLDPRWEGWSIVTWEVSAPHVGVMRHSRTVRGCVGVWWAEALMAAEGRVPHAALLCVVPISPAGARALGVHADGRP